MVSSQTEVIQDLIDARPAVGFATIYEAGNLVSHNFCTDQPCATFAKGGLTHTVHPATSSLIVTATTASVVPECLPIRRKRLNVCILLAGWLGVLSDKPSAAHDLIHANYLRGLVLTSMRGPTHSRYHV